MAQSDDIRTVIQEAYTEIHHELQVKGNILFNVFSTPEEYDQGQKFVRFMDRHDATHNLDGNGNFSDAGEVLPPATATGVSPTPVRKGSRGRATSAKRPSVWRSRKVLNYSSSIHVEVTRAEMQTAGSERDKMLELKKMSAKFSMREAALSHVIELILGAYQETPRNTVAVPHPVQYKILSPYEIVPTGDGTGTVRALRDFAIDDMYWLNEEVDSAISLSPEGAAGVRPGFEKVKRVLILTYQGYETFLVNSFGVREDVQATGRVIGSGAGRRVALQQLHDHKSRGRKNDMDTINIKGYGQYSMIDGTLIIPVPNNLLPPHVAAGNTAITTDPHLKAAGLLWPSGAAANGLDRYPRRGEEQPNGNPLASGVSSIGLHRAIMVSPRSFSLHKPKSLGLPGVVYRDKDSSFEEGFYSEFVTGGVRRYDNAVCEFFFPLVDRTTPTTV